MHIIKIALLIFFILVIGCIVACITPGFGSLLISMAELFATIIEIVIAIAILIALLKLFK